MIKFIGGLLCGALTALGIKKFLDEASRAERPNQTMRNPRSW